jgi:zinc protease
MKTTSLKIMGFKLAILLMTAACFYPLNANAAQFPEPDTLRYPALYFKLPRAERLILDNGIVLYFLRDSELPLISIHALIRTGTIFDPTDKEGVAELTAHVMRTGGTTKLGSDALDERLDFLAVSPAIAMSMEFASIEFSFLKNDLEPCLDILSQILMTPAFEQNKLDLAIRLKIEDLRRIKDDPQKLAFREFNRLIYLNSPRGRFPSQASLKNIDRNDLIKFHRQFFTPDKMILSITGDITKEQALEITKKYFSSWKRNDHTVEFPKPPQQNNSGLYFIDKKIPQTTIISGEYSPAKNSVDFYPFTILDFIAGSGGFPSRIFTAVRSNEGLAYSAGSFYRARSDYGIFGTYAFTKTESTYLALEILSSILKDLQSGTFSASEIEWAKKSIQNGFIFSFTSPGQIAWQQMKVEYEKLPSDYLTNYRDKIEKVTAVDLSRVAAKYLNKRKRIVLILGDTENFKQPSINIGKPIIISPSE